MQHSGTKSGVRRTWRACGECSCHGCGFALSSPVVRDGTAVCWALRISYTRRPPSVLLCSRLDRAGTLTAIGCEIP